jgi:predicted molibdopterin-dependent oxidoreductase YjgC
LRLPKIARIGLIDRWQNDAAMVIPGELFATFHTTDAFLNRLTGPGRDNVVHTPEYKIVVVRIEKLSAVIK